MVQCPASPDHLWIQHHSGMFRSRDGGVNWTEMTDVRPSTFGFAVAVHPRDPETAWFVPAVKDGAYSGRRPLCRDTHARWRAVVHHPHRGLPPRPTIWCIAGPAVDDSGDRLAMGSTTGGLWLTEDQGDSWRGCRPTCRRSTRYASCDPSW
ncbi:MAG: hypothetical protein U0736_08755 [Gemmataceae bacterium]